MPTNQPRPLVAALPALPALLLALACCACAPSLAGTWASETGNGSLELRPDGKAYMTTFGGTVACTYEIDGDRVLLKGPNGTQVLTRSGDRLEAGLGLSFVRR
jgi:hypothetical protein